MKMLDLNEKYISKLLSSHSKRVKDHKLRFKSSKSKQNSSRKKIFSKYMLHEVKL